jgi:hypothetical protein
VVLVSNISHGTSSGLVPVLFFHENGTFRVIRKSQAIRGARTTSFSIIGHNWE